MKYLLTIILVITLVQGLTQRKKFNAHILNLPDELCSADNQFSGLAIQHGKLFLMSESRLQDNFEGKIYTIKLKELNKLICDTTYVVQYDKIPIINLNVLKNKIESLEQHYEGLEAIIVDNFNVYLSVETSTTSNFGYILHGKLMKDFVLMDTTFLISLKKPFRLDSAHIYNAGFEALVKEQKCLSAFYEYNYFPSVNHVLQITEDSFVDKLIINRKPLKRLPFRLTDITITDKKHLTAINYFYKGEEGDTIYRPQLTDINSKFITVDGEGYRNYCRLIDIKYYRKKIKWKTIWEFPQNLMDYNWEGIASYKKGYFVINDMYTPKKPFYSVLLYIK